MLQQAEHFTDYVQIDIMDGRFVPSKSITWDQITGVPPRVIWEAHLMVDHPEIQFENFQKAGARQSYFPL